MNDVMGNRISIDADAINRMLDEKTEIKLLLSNCVSCGLCSGTCFYYKKTKDPESTPSYKALNSMGLLFRKKGKISPQDLDRIKSLIWGKCVLCGQCRCPIGVSIPYIIAWARAICRSQGVCENYADSPMGA